ncbi:MAG: phosphate ABC transporter substrate-binding protein PstS, partial [Bacteriovoracaceae bacterium]
SFLTSILISSQLYSEELINGAGSTFAAPIYFKWFAEYQKANPKIKLNYQSVGSGAGIKQLLAGTVSFAGSDAPLSDDEKKQSTLVIKQIPVVLGAVVIAYNLSGDLKNLKLDEATLSKIALGEITEWNNPDIQKLNKDLKLPDSKILFVHRSDGSGTTAVFTDYLSKVSVSWKEKVGTGKSVNWPIGIGGKGNEGVTALISQTPGSIGYTELAYAINNKLNMASLKNAKGKFVAPTTNSVSASVPGKNYKGDYVGSIVNSDNADAYPISSFTYFLLPEKNDNVTKELKSFLNWALSTGQAFAEGLFYAPLPKAALAKIKTAI